MARNDSNVLDCYLMPCVIDRAVCARTRHSRYTLASYA